MRTVLASERAAYWSEGTRSELALVGGPLAVIEEWMPADSGPPLHSHPEDEVYHILDGHLTVWVIPSPLEPFDEWTPQLLDAGVKCGPGDTVFISGGSAHCYRVAHDGPVNVLVLSRPSGLEKWTLRFGIVAQAAGMPPRNFVSPAPERQEVVAFSRDLGVRRLGPPAPRGSALDRREQPGFVARPDERAPTKSRGTRVHEVLSAELTGARLMIDEHWWAERERPTFVHADADTFYVVREGQVEARSFELEDATIVCDVGAVMHVPPGTEHGFRVRGGGARVLVIRVPRDS